MKTRRIISVILALAAFLSLFSTAAYAAPYANGNFEVQTSTRWNNVKLGGSTYGKSGSLIFAIANAISALNGKEVDIRDLGSCAAKRISFTDNAQLDPQEVYSFLKYFYKYYRGRYHFTFSNSVGSSGTASSPSLLNHLKNGGTAIARIDGHYVALVDYDSGKNKILIYDSLPNAARYTTVNPKGSWVAPSKLTSGKAKLDWFLLLEEIFVPEVIRLYCVENPNTKEQIWTGSEEEKNNLVNVGWVEIFTQALVPVRRGETLYRMYNPNTGEHHYTASPVEIQYLKDAGWRYEGAAFNSAPALPTDMPSLLDRVAYHRYYNPNATVGIHRYVWRESDREKLEEAGWIYENVGFYAYH